MPRRPSRGRAGRAPQNNALQPLTSDSRRTLSRSSPQNSCSDIVASIPEAESVTSSSRGTWSRKQLRSSTAKPFPFLSLPSELRIAVYKHFFSGVDNVVDLGPGNYKKFHKSLGLLRVCKQIHDEGTHLFYGMKTFRIFPTYPGRFIKTKPLLARLKAFQRQCIATLELRLGPGWNAPPKGWVVNEALGLKDCRYVQQVRVFVECDPSDNAFKGFRRYDGFYEGFCCRLLAGILDELPPSSAVEFDAWPSVKKTGAMMRALLHIAIQHQRPILWGPERGWADLSDGETEVQSKQEGDGAKTGSSDPHEDVPRDGHPFSLLIMA